MVRRKENTDSVNASDDVEFVKLLMNESEADEVRYFWNWFLSRFLRGFPKGLPNEVWKAFLLMVSLALMNVEDIDGGEEVELVPFINAFVQDDWFAGSLQFLAAIIFGATMPRYCMVNWGCSFWYGNLELLY
jgi:hypothetical protein